MRREKLAARAAERAADAALGAFIIGQQSIQNTNLHAIREAVAVPVVRATAVATLTTAASSALCATFRGRVRGCRDKCSA